MPIDPSAITECYARLTDGHIIDAIDPKTGKGLYGGRTLEEVRQDYPGAERMKLSDWQAHRAEQQRTPVTWLETDADTYHDMMGVLPPAAFEPGGFLVGEPSGHEADTGRPRFAAYRHRGELYEVASRPLTRAEFRAAI